MSVNCLIESPVMARTSLEAILKEINLLETKVREMSVANQLIQVDSVIATESGSKIGIQNVGSNEVKIVYDKEDKNAVELANIVRQRISRLQILDAVKGKGYRKVKEEKLANGSIRLVVERWQ